jgi:hypothetical protein
MTPLRAFRKTMTILASALAFAGLVCLLPENEYQRWQSLGGTINESAPRIYERCHFDPTPVDVVFLGSSRVALGVDAPRLGAALAAKDLPASVVNFALPGGGRDLNYIVAEQVFVTKKPRLIVLEVVEKPSRFGHEAFKYIAEPSAVAAPGYLADLNYFSNLIYLPFRQMRLFAADLFPQASALPKTFDPVHLRGASANMTGSQNQLDRTDVEDQAPVSIAALLRGVHKLEAGMHPPMLPESLADYEFGDERHYTRAIVDLARGHGARIAFLFLPYYTGRSTLQEQAFYEQFGPVWNAGYLSSHAEWYVDYGHLNRTGAHQVTDWLVERAAKELNSWTPLQ